MSNAAETAAQTTGWPTGLFAITLFAEDLDQTKAFYQQVFGLPVYFEDANSAVFRFGGTLINLLKISEADELVAPAQVAARTSGARSVITLSVDDVDAMCAVLAGRGVPLLNGPLDRPWGVRTASFLDPTGQIWEIAK